MRFEDILKNFPDAKKSGNGWTAKCPAHDDGTASLSINEGSDGRTLLKCHAGCTVVNVCAVLGLKPRDLFADNGHAQRNGSSAQSKHAFDWLKCVADFGEADMKIMATTRGLSVEFVRWLHAQRIVGMFEGKTAFANHGTGGLVVSCHVKLTNGNWIFKPEGQSTAPLIFGEAKAAGSTLTFESQWDAFAVMDKFGWHTANGLPDTAVFITRGAANGKLIRGSVNSTALVYAFKQNDVPTPKKPIPASDIWLADIASNAGCKVLNVITPAANKDVNDWTLAGATKESLESAMIAAKVVQSPAAINSNQSGLAEEYLGNESAQTGMPLSVNTDLIKRLETRIYSAAVKPEEPSPRFYLNGIQICTPGNLTTVSAHAKAGKSAAIGAMIASTFSTTNKGCLGFTSNNSHGHAVLHIDTEQTPFDHWESVQRATRRANVTATPPWLQSYCLTGFSSSDIREAIPILMTQSANQFGGVHSVFIDGVADAVNDVNDPTETSSLITEFQKFAIEFNCPILNIIHINPGSDFKTRGHLGSQLERKSETNLRLEKDDGERTVIWADKNRRAPIPKKTAPRFAWSEEAGMHVTVPSMRAEKDNIEREDLAQNFREILADRPAMRYADLQTAVKTKLTVSDKTAERRIKAAVTFGIIKKNFGGLYTAIT
jgi:hypothetical protein